MNADLFKINSAKAFVRVDWRASAALKALVAHWNTCIR